MLRSMYSAIAGMKANQTKLDVIGNNIANVSTTAFKASKVNFADSLYQSMTNATAATTTTGGTNSKSVGLGSKVSSVNKLMTNGNALTTGRTLDLDIDGDGYFVATKGTVDGTIPIATSTNTIDSTTTGTGTISDTLYTRNGNLTLDAAGNLITSDGYRVMGYLTSGASVTYNSGGTGVETITGVSTSDTSLAYDDSQLSALAIPDKITNSSGTEEAVTAVGIGTDGVITVTTASGKYVLGQVAMASFKNTEGLQDAGGSYQKESTNSGEAIIRTSATTTNTTDNSGAFGSVKSGYLEASNVDLTEQFTDMISATRSFQAASKMISNGDEILQTITGLIR